MHIYVTFEHHQMCENRKEEEKEEVEEALRAMLRSNKVFHPFLHLLRRTHWQISDHIYEMLSQEIS